MQAHLRSEQRTLESLQQAVDLYQKAIKEDANFALAYAELSGVESALLQLDFPARAQMLEASKMHAQLAVAKGPGYAESYSALAVTEQNSWKWQAAEQYYRRAIALNPKLAAAHHNYGGFLIQFGRFDEGLREAREAISLEPFDQANRYYLGGFLTYAGQPAETVKILQGFLQERDYAQGHNLLGYAYAALALRATGPQRTELLNLALREADALAKEDPSGAASPMYALFYALRGDRQRASSYLKVLLAGQATGTTDPADLAQSYVALGESEAALAVLRRGVQAKDSGLLYIKVDPFLEPLRSTREFRTLVTQMGL
jgi:tetratricopeptide (TPR) repeat protein